MYMKKAILSLIIVFAASIAFAQNTKTAEKRAEEKVAELNKLVSLNEEQRTNAYYIYLKQEMKYDMDVKDNVPNSENAKKAEAERREYVDTHIKMVLNEKQFEILMQHRKELLKKRKSNTLQESDI
jgi:hypothetical protein